jgi:hypothetical protein
MLIWSAVSKVQKAWLRCLSPADRGIRHTQEGINQQIGELTCIRMSQRVSKRAFDRQRPTAKKKASPKAGRQYNFRIAPDLPTFLKRKPSTQPQAAPSAVIT